MVFSAIAARQRMLNAQRRIKAPPALGQSVERSSPPWSGVCWGERCLEFFRFPRGARCVGQRDLYPIAVFSEVHVDEIECALQTLENSNLR